MDARLPIFTVTAADLFGADAAAHIDTHVLNETDRRREPRRFDRCTYVGRNFAGRVDAGFGNPIRLRDNTVDGQKVSARVDELPGGDYVIGYRVTSADGHVIQGSSRFTVAGGTNGAGGSDTAAEGATPSQQPAARDSDSAGSGTALFVLGGLAILLIGGALVLLRRGQN